MPISINGAPVYTVRMNTPSTLEFANYVVRNPVSAGQSIQSLCFTPGAYLLLLGNGGNRNINFRTGSRSTNSSPQWTISIPSVGQPTGSEVIYMFLTIYGEDGSLSFLEIEWAANNTGQRGQRGSPTIGGYGGSSFKVNGTWGTSSSGITWSSQTMNIAITGPYTCASWGGGYVKY